MKTIRHVAEKHEPQIAHAEIEQWRKYENYECARPPSSRVWIIKSQHRTPKTTH